MGKKVHESSSENDSTREGEHLSGRIVWHQIAVRHSSVWHPPTDVYHTEDKLVVLIEIAGLQEQDFQVVLQERTLTVSGTRQHVSGKAEDVAYHQMEIERGAFRTEIQLPWNVRRDLVTATYREGLLKIELPRAAATSVRVINLSHGQTNET
jgi:HSP20 family protein